MNGKSGVPCHLSDVGMEANVRYRETQTPMAVHNSRQHAESRSRCAALVVLQQAAERLVADDFLQSELVGRHWRRQVSIDGHIADPLVRAIFVIVGHPAVEDMPQVVLAENDEVVETFRFYPPHKRLRVGIQIWTSRRNGPKVDAVGLQERTEVFAELAVAVANDVRRSELGLLFVEDHAHVPSSLSHPSVVGIGRYAGDVNATCVQVDEKQHVVRDRPSQSPDSLGEEVRCPNSFDVPFDEVVPRPRFGPGSKPFSCRMRATVAWEML
jgi:hypothetical protein